MLQSISTSPPQNITSEDGGKPQARGLWYVWKAIYILYSIEIGIFLICLPWTRVWESNYLLFVFPQIRPIVANSFFKGFVLGLGIVNILIGIREVAQIISLWKKNRISR
jgi:hypothetical protein